MVGYPPMLSHNAPPAPGETVPDAVAEVPAQPAPSKAAGAAQLVGQGINCKESRHSGIQSGTPVITMVTIWNYQL